MAYLQSFHFSTPFGCCNTQFRGDTRRYIDGRLMNLATSTAGKRHQLCKYYGGNMVSSHRCRHWNICVSTKQFEPILCHFGVGIWGEVQISGFWVGPEIDDGWGFVEASVRRIF